MHKTRRRFRGYDYARGGAMFVTICLEQRRRLFGRVDHDDDLWRAVGNFDLLENSRIVSLRISQKVPESELPGVVSACRRGAIEKGYVYASTFFSPGERMVFKVLTEEDGVPMIRLVPTFMELACRPHGVEPLLFAKKRLLVLSRMADPEEPPRRGELVGRQPACGPLSGLQERNLCNQ